MSKLDPNARAEARKAEGKSEVPELGGQTERINRNTRVLLAPCGWEHYESTKKHTPGVLVRWVALEGPDAGKVTERTFWKSDAAADQFLDYCLAAGYREPIDWDDDDDLEALFTGGDSKGVVLADIKVEDTWTRNDGTEVKTYRPAWFGPSNVPKPSAEQAKRWNALIKAAEEGWDRYMQWRETHPRGQSRGGGGGGGRDYDDGAGGQDEEIPF